MRVRQVVAFAGSAETAVCVSSEEAAQKEQVTTVDGAETEGTANEESLSEMAENEPVDDLNL